MHHAMPDDGGQRQAAKPADCLLDRILGVFHGLILHFPFEYNSLDLGAASHSKEHSGRVRV